MGTGQIKRQFSEVEEELYFRVRLRGGKEERVYESGLKGSLRK